MKSSRQTNEIPSLTPPKAPPIPPSPPPARRLKNGTRIRRSGNPIYIYPGAATRQHRALLFQDRVFVLNYAATPLTTV